MNALALCLFALIPQSGDTHLIGELDGVGIELALLDRLLTLGLTVESNDLDLVGLARFFKGGTGAEA